MTGPIDLAQLRNDYQAAGLAADSLPEQPIELWRSWFADAEAAGIAEINAMIVSTVDSDGTPSSRNVLCKAADDDGFVFFTSYTSRKGQALAAEPRCSLLFSWHQLSRQVIVAGVATRVDRDESEAYFATRPRGAQLSAWASDQSQLVGSRSELEARVTALQVEYADREVPCPPHWGGYRVTPTSIEFWQGRHDRLHDRLRYRREGGHWVVERLCP